MSFLFVSICVVFVDSVEFIPDNDDDKPFILLISNAAPLSLIAVVLVAFNACSRQRLLLLLIPLS